MIKSYIAALAITLIAVSYSLSIASKPSPSRPAKPLTSTQPDSSPMVTVNPRTGIYHLQGERWFDHVKGGIDMHENEAKSHGYRASRNHQ